MTGHTADKYTSSGIYMLAGPRKSEHLGFVEVPLETYNQISLWFKKNRQTENVLFLPFENPRIPLE